MRSSRSNVVVSVAITLAIAGASRASAHRLDEYLQAARIAIDPGRVKIELDLTPGIAVAPKLIAEIDADKDGTISRTETRTYAMRVAADLHAAVDDHPLTLQLVESAAPAASALRAGNAAVRLEMTAALPALKSGAHRLHFRNAHHADIGVYLANALVPATDQIVVVDQARDADQRDLIIAFVWRARANGTWVPLGLGLAMTILAGVWLLRR